MYTPKTSLIPHGLRELPFAVFKFRYRPIGMSMSSTLVARYTYYECPELLKANGVVPLIPSSPGVESKDGILRAVTESGNPGPSQPRQAKPEPRNDEGNPDDDREVFLQVSHTSHVFTAQTIGRHGEMSSRNRLQCFNASWNKKGQRSQMLRSSVKRIPPLVCRHVGKTRSSI